MDIFGRMAEKIITEQESIIGPIALEQAKKVNGLNIDWVKHEVNMNGDQKDILEKLIEQYQNLFGKASVEVCRDAVKELIGELPKDKIPPLLL